MMQNIFLWYICFMQREWTRFSLEVPTSGYLLMSVFTLLQLDANLIEGEPYNRLTYLKK